MQMNSQCSLVAAVLVAAAIAGAGWFVGRGFAEGRAQERYVTVKGVSERDVQADVALWPLRFVSTDDDLARAEHKIEQDRLAVLAFLDRHGIDPSMAEVQSLDVTDILANPYRSGPAQSRFIISQTLMVRSEDPHRILAASQKVGELVRAGVVLSGIAGGGIGPTFLFKGLNPLKPGMIAAATASARQGAAQFAQDSGCALGAIRRANQGVFEILPRDRASGIMEEKQIAKTVRVVSTIEFALED